MPLVSDAASIPLARNLDVDFAANFGEGTSESAHQGQGVRIPRGIDDGGRTSAGDPENGVHGRHTQLT
jgi:hypothetical protein